MKLPFLNFTVFKFPSFGVSSNPVIWLISSFDLGIIFRT